MPEGSSDAEIYFVGVDGGGTKCRAVLMNSANAILGNGEGGPANAYQNFELAIESINQALDSAIADAGLTRDIKNRLVVGLGLAGANVPNVREKLCQYGFPFLATFVETDLHIATIAAHNNSDGAVLVVGTGSCGFSNVNGKQTSLGGHGFPLGDKGSGAWLGLACVQAVLLHEDGLGPATSLSTSVSEALNAQGFALVERLTNAGQRDFAALAPLVFAALEQNDPVAKAIVQEGADYLSALARALLRTQPPRLCAIGGLADKMLPWMDLELTQQFSQPQLPPEAGAVLFAQSQFRSQESTADTPDNG